MNNTENIEKKCLIEIVGVDKSYATKRETIHVLNDTHLKIFSVNLVASANLVEETG